MKKTLKKNEVHIIVDFSQNYECKYNKEVHAVHFGASKKQVSLHVGGFYYKNDKDEIAFESFCCVSDCLRHDASAVWALLNPVLKRVQELLPDVESIHFQSDGPTSQYRNKTNFFKFNYFCQDLELEQATWNFTSSGHGKSIGDASGANVKEMCNSAVMFGEDVIYAKNVKTVVEKKISK